MPEHLDLGRQGEAWAATFLTEKGYAILHANWRYRKAEVDLIALKDNTLVFVEVKTRASSRFGSPEMFVNKRKQRFLASAASAFSEELGHRGDIRFDIIGILVLDGMPQINHVPDAFFPGLF